MSRQFSAVNRRRFLQSTALGAAAAGVLHAPAVLRAQGAPVKVGVLHPVSGALSYSGQQGRIGATTRDRGDQRGRRHQGARRRQDRSGARRRAIDAGRRQRRGREDERGRRRGRRRRLRQRHLPRRQPDRGALRPALYRRRRRGRQHRQPRPEEHLPVRPGLRRHRQDRARQSRHHQRPGRQGRQDRDDRARGLGVRRRPRQAPERATARARLPGARNHSASDADPRLQQRRAQDQGAEPRHRHSGQLLQRIRAAGAHHAAAARPAEGHLLGARRRGLVLQVRQGIPGGRAIHHGLQSLVRPEESEGAGAEEEDRGQGRVLHLRSLHELLVRPAARRRARARRERRPRQDHCRAGKLDLRRPRDALRPDQVRQRPEPGRGAGQHPGGRTRISR